MRDPRKPASSLLALLTDGFGAYGGIARYNSDLMTALAMSPRFGEIVALPRFAGTDAALPPGVQQLRPRPGGAAWSMTALSLAARRQIDLIFCGHLNAAPLAAAIARARRRPLWLQAHGIEAWPPRGRGIRRALECAALVTCVSRYTRERLLSWSNADPARVRVLPNTVAAKPAPLGSRPGLVAHYGLEGRKVILTVGRLSASERYKGHDRIIRALPAISARHPDVSYLIVGTGDDLPRLQALAAEQGVAQRVVFAGKIADAELPDTFALADVFAMPSTGEGFGIVFLEAARHGLPVVGGNRDGSADALADGAIGRLVDPDDSEALVEAIVTALADTRGKAVAAVERFQFRNFARHVDELVASIT